MTTGLMAALAALLVLGCARRAVARVGPQTDPGAAELAELDRLRERGLLDDANWSLARAEAGRRVLSAVQPVQPVAVGPHDGRVVLAALIGVAALALAIYVGTGSPGQPDAPYRQRVDEWAGQLDTLEAPQLAAVAARLVDERPNDRQALTMLGAARFEAGDPIGAASALRRALDLNAEDAQTWARLGEALVRSQEGVVGGEAEAAFGEALKRDANQLAARFFLGEAALARGDVAGTRTMWTPLIDALDPTDPRRADLVARLAAASQTWAT